MGGVTQLDGQLAKAAFSNHEKKEGRKTNGGGGRRGSARRCAWRR